MAKTEKRPDLSIEDISRGLVLTLIGRYGLKDATKIADELHKRINKELASQKERHPEDWKQ